MVLSPAVVGKLVLLSTKNAYGVTQQMLMIIFCFMLQLFVHFFHSCLCKNSLLTSYGYLSGDFIQGSFSMLIRRHKCSLVGREA